MPAPATTLLGPGTITIGETGTLVDFSAQLIGGTVEWDKDTEDDVPVLDGGVVAGETTYTATISGEVFQDLAAVDGLVEWTWANKGAEVPLVFTPNTAAGKQVSGTVIVDPLAVGGDEAKKRMRSDFEWSFVGEPALEAIGAGDAPAFADFAPEPVE